MTDSEIKRNRSEVSSKWNKCRIYGRDQLDRCRWMERTQGSATRQISRTGTCGQDPMLLPFFFKMLPPPFFLYFFYFLTSTLCHINNILQLSMYHCMTYKYNQTVVSIHARFLTRYKFSTSLNIELCYGSQNDIFLSVNYHNSGKSV